MSQNGKIPKEKKSQTKQISSPHTTTSTTEENNLTFAVIPLLRVSHRQSQPLIGQEFERGRFSRAQHKSLLLPYFLSPTLSLSLPLPSLLSLCLCLSLSQALQILLIPLAQ